MSMLPPRVHLVIHWPRPKSPCLREWVLCRRPLLGYRRNSHLQSLAHRLPRPRTQRDTILHTVCVSRCRRLSSSEVPLVRTGSFIMVGHVGDFWLLHFVRRSSSPLSRLHPGRLWSPFDQRFRSFRIQLPLHSQFLQIFVHSLIGQHSSWSLLRHHKAVSATNLLEHLSHTWKSDETWIRLCTRRNYSHNSGILYN